MPTTPALRAWPVNEEEYSIVVDKGPFTHLELEEPGVGGQPAGVSMHTFRLFNFKLGHAVHAGMPGRYVVNTHADADEDEPMSSGDLTLPALIVPADPGEPPVIGLYWKVKSTNKIYAQVIPTDLKQAADRSTGSETWLQDSDAYPMKVELISELKPLCSKDGNNLVKTFDEWLKNHSEYFRARSIRNHAACRAWLTHSSYISHFNSIMVLCQQAIRAEVMQAHGLTKSNPKGKGAAPQPTEAAKGAMDDKWSYLCQVAEPLRLSLIEASVPIGNRIIQVDLPFVAEDAEFGPAELQELP